MSAPQETEISAPLYVVFVGCDPTTGEMLYGLYTDDENRNSFAVQGSLQQGSSLEDDIREMLEIAEGDYDPLLTCDLLYTDYGQNRWTTTHFAKAQVDISIWNTEKERGHPLPSVYFLPLEQLRLIYADMRQRRAVPSSFISTWRMLGIDKRT